MIYLYTRPGVQGLSRYEKGHRWLHTGSGKWHTEYLRLRKSWSAPTVLYISYNLRSAVLERDLHGRRSTTHVSNRVSSHTRCMAVCESWSGLSKTVFAYQIPAASSNTYHATSPLRRWRRTFGHNSPRPKGISNSSSTTYAAQRGKRTRIHPVEYVLSSRLHLHRRLVGLILGGIHVVVEPTSGGCSVSSRYDGQTGRCEVIYYPQLLKKTDSYRLLVSGSKVCAR